MGIFVIGDIDVNIIKKLITENFSLFENKDVEIPDYKVPDFQENQFFQYQDEETNRITFDLWEKTDFQKLNNFDNYREDRIYSLIGDIYKRRIDELLEKNELAFLGSGLGNYQISDLNEYKIISVTLNEAKIEEGIVDFLTVINQIEKFGFLNSELDLAKKNYLQYLQQNISDDETRSSVSYATEYQRHFLDDEMISSPEDQLKYTKKMLPSIRIDDLNNYFRKYTQAKNQIISIKAPTYIKDLPNEGEIKKLFNEVKNKDIEPYEFEVKDVKLIKEKLVGSKIIKRVYRIFKGKKKILAFPNNNNFSDFWCINCVKSGISYCSVHLHNFLIISKGCIKMIKNFLKIQLNTFLMQAHQKVDSMRV